MLASRRWLAGGALIVLVFLIYTKQPWTYTTGALPQTLPFTSSSPKQPVDDPRTQIDLQDGRFHWDNVEQHYPVQSLIPVPTGRSSSIPKIQHTEWKESAAARGVREQRQNAVLGNFTHSWAGYRSHAWLQDEVGPLSGKAYDHFGGWAATLVDGLDTLWIMGLKEEFEEAVAAVEQIDFSKCALEQLNVFETTIRYLGGLLGAYDLTDGKYPGLLKAAKELGQMIYKTFDTPNRMPVLRWSLDAARQGVLQTAPSGAIVAEVGSFSLELTRLSQITGDNRYYDAIARITDAFEAQQSKTQLPGLFPVMVNPRDLDFTHGGVFTLGGMVDSLYEYLPKEHLLLNGASEQYRKLYEAALKPMTEHLFYKPSTPDGADILLAGQAFVSGPPGDTLMQLDPQAQHLACFVGGMVALGAKAFNRPEDLSTARRLVDGCTWAYGAHALGIMPEIMHTLPCPREGACPWSEAAWLAAVDARNFQAADADDSALAKAAKHHLPRGVTSIDDTRYGLRPEAIESVFVLYRLTGDTRLQDTAWSMWEAVASATHTDIGAAAMEDCTNPDEPVLDDRMESFWFAETLKYFYLVFSEPDLVSLDDYVLNTEAHPLKRPA